MQNQFDPRTTTGGYDPAVSVGVPRAARDAGLRSYMLKVYNYMASGVLLTGIVALLFANSGMAAQVFQGGGLLPWVIILSPLAIVFAMSFGQNRMQTSTLQTAVLVVRDADGPQHVDHLPGLHRNVDCPDLLRGLGGLPRAQPVGLHDQEGFVGFRHLPDHGRGRAAGGDGDQHLPAVSAMSMAISAIGVLLFAGLTAYDTQRIKSMYAHVAGTDMMGKTVIMGALSLYLDFINMFQFLLSFMGNRD